MKHSRKLHLILCWHMHQPDYRNQATNQYELPWTYLHAIKDYTDMAWHLEQHPGMRSVINLVPSLVDQLQDYEHQFVTGILRDPLLLMLATEDLSTLPEVQKTYILNQCFRSNLATMIDPFPAYSRLHQMNGLLKDSAELQYGYFTAQYLADLLVWYHLAWTAESVRRTNPLVQQLMAKNSLFTYQDRKHLLDLIGELISGLIPRFKKLQDVGQIEISTTPYYHPILPLLLDFGTAREAIPEVLLPRSACYPGGMLRAQDQISAAQAHYRRVFGGEPRGMWPGEGGLSQSAIELLSHQGCQWTATGEAVLRNSLRRLRGDSMGDRTRYLYRPYRYHEGPDAIYCFFRDDRLSDKIGFEYSKWHSRDAVSDFVNALEGIYNQTDPLEAPVVSIILDGENAWEHYPYNGFYFLDSLYEALQSHPFICTTTFSECVQQLHDVPPATVQRISTDQAPALVAREMPPIVSGSWVYGTFSTWIGNPEKNHAWDLLVEAKTCYDRVIHSGRLTSDEQQVATRQLGICEGSDWFWWFGDYNPAESVQSFDRLYRVNLANLYQLLKLPVPVELQHPISLSGGSPAAMGTMRRSTE